MKEEVKKVEKYPKLVYRVYERIGTRLELAGDFRFKIFSDRKSALKEVKLYGQHMKCYVLLEEISVYADINYK